MNQPPHMHQVRDYYIYIDYNGDVWKLVPACSWDRVGSPFTITLLHKA